MSSGDETYLEAFVESLATLPYQVRRNLELVQDLDGSYQNGLAELQELYTAYIQQAEEKVLQLKVAPTENGQGVRVIRKDGENAPVVIPTTAEFMEYTYDASAMHQIEALQAECLQKADEKVFVARQAYEWIDAAVDRLDDDLQALSKLLQAQGEFQQETVAQPNDLAACQVSNEWILAKVLEFDSKTRTYKLIDEDVESHKGKSVRRAQNAAAKYLLCPQLLFHFVVFVQSFTYRKIKSSSSEAQTGLAKVTLSLPCIRTLPRSTKLPSFKCQEKRLARVRLLSLSAFWTIQMSLA